MEKCKSTSRYLPQWTLFLQLKIQRIALSLINVQEENTECRLSTLKIQRHCQGKVCLSKLKLRKLNSQQYRAVGFL
jgi:hypothetical protein